MEIDNGREYVDSDCCSSLREEMRAQTTTDDLFDVPMTHGARCAVMFSSLHRTRDISLEH